MTDCFTHVRQTEKSEHDDNDQSWHRNQESEAAGVFRSEQIKQSNEENRGSGKFLRMRNAEISKGRKRANGCGYQIIGNEQKRANDRENFATVPYACVNA